MNWFLYDRGLRHERVNYGHKIAHKSRDIYNKSIDFFIYACNV